MPGDEKAPDKAGGEEAPGRKLRPTVIDWPRGQGSPAERGKRVTVAFGPTVIERADEPRGDRPAAAEPRRPEPAARAVERPTAVRGTERRRISVSAEDLRKVSPQASPRVVAEALRSIGMFPAESASERQAVLWGHDAQKRYGALVSRAVDLSQAPVLARTAGYLRRMTEVLSLIDVEAACGAAAEAGVLDRMLRRAGARIDTAEELEAARVEIDQLVGLTGAALEELLSLRQKLERLGDEVDETARAIEAAALAAQFLSEHLRGKRDDLARHFFERGMSLTQSLAQLQAGASVTAVQAEQPLRLIAAVQNVVLVSLPGLLGSFAALNVLARGGRRPNPTEAGEVAFRLRDILEQLES